MASDYTTMQGDMWDSISHRVYGTERYIRRLIEANPIHAGVWKFSGGVKLRVPEAPPSEEDVSRLPPWRR